MLLLLALNNSILAGLGAVNIKVNDSLPDRTKIIKNEIFRPGSFWKH